MHVHAGIKRSVLGGNFSILWHRRLEHIFLPRIKRLENDELLGTLEFADFNTCMTCIKGKQSNKSNKVPKEVLTC